MRSILLCVCILLLHISLSAQPCTAPGQNPSTAFPVCGTSVFTQTTVPLCGGKALPYKGCGTNSGLSDINPFWYKFTCFQAGTLGFLITPKDMGDDYDWELYDVTGRDPNDIYTDASLVVANNWSGETGLTGASNAGTQGFVCGGRGRPLFSKMPELKAGHNYLLLISHFTRSQSGYTLSFQGGTAVITDSGTPHLKNVEANCGGNVLRLALNKNIKCSSLDPDGSDFSLSAPGITITRSQSINCSSRFDTDSVEITLSAPLAPGTYTLRMKKGNDNNTLLDYCDNAVPETDELNITIQPRSATPMDSLVPVSCSPKELKLVFQKPISCASIAADGSDFSISGTYPVSIASLSGLCNGATTTREITITLANPLVQAGQFTLTLQNGRDGNTLLDECGEQTPAGSSLSFTVKDTVSAQFSYNIGYGCTADTVAFVHNGENGVDSWQWNLDENQRSTLQNPVGIYQVFNEKTITLKVSNGFCSDSTTQKIVLDNFIQADFTVFEENCPAEPIAFTSTAKGAIVSHSWDFGNGSRSNAASPTHVYAAPQRETPYNVRYTVTDQYGCEHTVQKKVIIYASCYLAVPSAFTPNGDGLNDVLRPLNAIKADQLEFRVYNRWGQLLYKTTDWKQGWDGKVNGKAQPTGVYIWMLRYKSRDTQQLLEQKGTAALIR